MTTNTPRFVKENLILINKLHVEDGICDQGNRYKKLVIKYKDMVSDTFHTKQMIQRSDEFMTALRAQINEGGIYNVIATKEKLEGYFKWTTITRHVE